MILLIPIHLDYYYLVVKVIQCGRTLAADNGQQDVPFWSDPAGCYRTHVIPRHRCQESSHHPTRNVPLMSIRSGGQSAVLSLPPHSVSPHSDHHTQIYIHRHRYRYRYTKREKRIQENKLIWWKYVPSVLSVPESMQYWLWSNRLVSVPHVWPWDLRPSVQCAGKTQSELM